MKRTEKKDGVKKWGLVEEKKLWNNITLWVGKQGHKTESRKRVAIKNLHLWLPSVLSFLCLCFRYSIYLQGLVWIIQNVTCIHKKIKTFLYPGLLLSKNTLSTVQHKTGYISDLLDEATEMMHTTRCTESQYCTVMEGPVVLCSRQHLSGSAGNHTTVTVLVPNY